MNDLELLQMRDRLHHGRMRYVELPARGHDTDDWLPLKQVMDAQHGTRRAPQRADARAIVFEQHQQLPRRLYRLGRGLNDAAQEKLDPCLPITSVPHGLE